MNHERTWNVVRALRLAPLVVLGAAGVLLGLTLPANADGDDSPAVCKTGSSTGEGNQVIAAGPGKVVDFICIKSGVEMFGTSKHSNPISTDGFYGNGGCYQVTGLGTSSVTVTKVGLTRGTATLARKRRWPHPSTLAAS